MTPSVCLRLAIVCILATAALAGDEGDFTTQAARAAQLRYHKRLTDIDAARNKQVRDAREEYLAALKPALDTVTRSGNIDEALRIRTEIDRLAAAADRAEPAALIRSWSGEWRLDWIGGPKVDIEIADGHLIVKDPAHKAPIREAAGSLLTESRNLHVELVPHGDHILFLGWEKRRNRATLPPKPDSVGVMTRVK